MPEAPVLMVGTDQELVEASLVRRQLGCPGCGEVLGPWAMPGDGCWCAGGAGRTGAPTSGEVPCL